MFRDKKKPYGKAALGTHSLTFHFKRLGRGKATKTRSLGAVEAVEMDGTMGGMWRWRESLGAAWRLGVVEAVEMVGRSCEVLGGRRRRLGAAWRLGAVEAVEMDGGDVR
ncbi:unnamed protein product [Calypogeia fissa]